MSAQNATASRRPNLNSDFGKDTIIWVDANARKINDDDSLRTIRKLRLFTDQIYLFDSVKPCVEMMKIITSKEIILITSGSFGQDLVSKVESMEQITSIYVFCGDVDLHKRWAKNYPKIKGVHNEIQPICDEIKKAMPIANRDTVSILFDLMDFKGFGKTNKHGLQPTFMYTQFFKKILLEIDHDADACKNLLKRRRDRHEDKVPVLNHIEELCSSYQPKDAIRWYTWNCIYAIANNALRLFEADVLIDVGFFIKDLHQSIAKLHREQLLELNHKPFRVYRGQQLSKDDLERFKTHYGKIFSFQSFLSTSRKESIAHLFRKGKENDMNFVSVLFTMDIDPSIKSAPFADVGIYGKYDEEEEVLFSTHTVFRVGSVCEKWGPDRYFEIQLTLTEINDKQFLELSKQVEEELCGKAGWQRLIDLLVQTQKFDEAATLCHQFLETTSDEKDQAFFNHYLAIVAEGQNNQNQAIDYYQKALSIRKRICPKHSHSIATLYNNIGLAYKRLGNYQTALEYYQKAMKIYQKIYSSSDIALANPYNNIGLLYDELEDYSRALDYCETALNIRQAKLSSNHPDIGQSYNNIALIYRNKGDNRQALSYYEKALKVLEQSLMPDHQHIQSVKDSIQSIKDKFKTRVDSRLNED